MTTYNTKYGKLEGDTVMKFAPGDMNETELLADGWLPIWDVCTEEETEDSEYVNIAVGWCQINGHFEKKFERRKKIELRAEYSKELLISNMGDNYQKFIQCLTNEYPLLLKEFNNSTVYLADCAALKQCIKIYGQITGLTEEQVQSQILNPSILNR